MKNKEEASLSGAVVSAEDRRVEVATLDVVGEPGGALRDDPMGQVELLAHRRVPSSADDGVATVIQNIHDCLCREGDRIEHREPFCKGEERMPRVVRRRDRSRVPAASGQRRTVKNRAKRSIADGLEDEKLVAMVCVGGRRCNVWVVCLFL